MKEWVFVYFIFLPFLSFSQTDTFSWTDSMLYSNSKRVIEFSYATDGPCTIVPCNDSNNKLVYDTVEGFLKSHPKIVVEISAHVDWTDDTLINYEVSKSQANKILGVLLGRGIEGNRIIAKGYGSSKPLVTESQKIGLSPKDLFFLRQEKNSRIELVVVGLLESKN